MLEKPEIGHLAFSIEIVSEGPVFSAKSVKPGDTT